VSELIAFLAGVSVGATVMMIAVVINDLRRFEA
jgi:hypothetical protein